MHLISEGGIDGRAPVPFSQILKVSTYSAWIYLWRCLDLPYINPLVGIYGL